jgi:hypothetical protein
MAKAKYVVLYTFAEEIEAKDNSEAKRIALQSCPNENCDVSMWLLDETGYRKGRII